jgi:hypothetical protein
MNRQERRRIAAIGVDVYMQEEAIINPNTTRRERRARARALRKRVMRESPRALFEKKQAPAIEAPHIIVPEIQVEADGAVPLGAQEKRSPSGLLVLP